MSTHQRLLSLDVLRGITVAGMILVNNAGACGYGYAPLRHAKWDGFTPADLVFPMFMFLMGISTYISLRKYNFRWQLTIGKIIKRAFLLILIGIAMKWLIHSFETGIWNDWEHMRILGVMQRLCRHGIIHPTQTFSSDSPALANRLFYPSTGRKRIREKSR